MDQKRVTIKAEIPKSESAESEIVVVRDDYRFPRRNLPIGNPVSSHVPSRSGDQDQVGEINPQLLPRGPNLNTPTEYNTSVPLDLSRVNKEIPNPHPTEQQLGVQDNDQASRQVIWDAQGRAVVNGELVTDRYGLPITRNDIIQCRKFVPLAIYGYTLTTIHPPEAMQILHCLEYGSDGFYIDPQEVNRSDDGQALAENTARNLFSSNYAGVAGVDPSFQCNNSVLQNHLNLQQNQYRIYPHQNVPRLNTVLPHHPQSVPYVGPDSFVPQQSGPNVVSESFVTPQSVPYVAPASFVAQVNGNTNGGICTRLDTPEQQMGEAILDLSGRRTPSEKEEHAFRKQCFLKRRSIKRSRGLRAAQRDPNVRTTSDAPMSSNSETYRPESPTNDDIYVGTGARAMRGSYFPEFSMGIPNNGIRNVNLQQNLYNSNFRYGAPTNNVSGNDSSASIATLAMPSIDPNHYMQSHFGLRNDGGNPLLVQRHLDKCNNGLSQQPCRPGSCMHEQFLQQLYASSSVNPPQDVGPLAGITSENDRQTTHHHQ